MSSHKGIIMLSLFCFFFLELSAQVGIGTANPDASAILDIESSNAGVLIPRIDLTSTTDVVTILAPANSLLVYNIATTTDLNPVYPGFYFWNEIDNQWIRIDDTPFIYGEIYANIAQTQRLYNNQAVLFGTNVVLQNITANINSFLIPISGIYRVSYALSIKKTTDDQTTMGFYLTTNNAGKDAALAAAIPGSFSHTRVVFNMPPAPLSIGTSNCRMTKIIHLNAGQRIYLFTDISNTGIYIMPNTLTMNIELIKAD